MARVAIITGGSSGIGAAVARRFARDGIKVVVVASADRAKAEAVARTIVAEGGAASAKAADLRDLNALRGLFAEVAGEEGGVDILVNSAGVFKPAPAGEADPATVDRMIDINLRATFLAIDTAVPLMKARGGGAIVNIASVASVIGLRGYAVYCATKAAVSMLTRSLALELAPHGININAIAPGNTATPMNEDIRTDPAFAPMLEAMATVTPSRRVYSEPEDIAELAAFLVGPAARAMHGSTVLIDEGLSAGM